MTMYAGLLMLLGFLGVQFLVWANLAPLIVFGEFVAPNNVAHGAHNQPLNRETPLKINYSCMHAWEP